jgi:hypothetical protein
MIQQFLIRKRDGAKLKPIKVDLHTWVLLPVEQATPENAAKRKAAIIESRRRAIGGKGYKDYENF